MDHRPVSPTSSPEGRRRAHRDRLAPYVERSRPSRRSPRKCSESNRGAVLRRSLLLVVPAVFADTSGHVCGVGAVPEVAPTSGHQGSLERDRPRFICLGEPTPGLVSRGPAAPGGMVRRLQIASSSCWRIWTGRRAAAFARVRTRAMSLCAPRHVGATTARVPPCPAPCEA
jgi:hypothetical protein